MLSYPSSLQDHSDFPTPITPILPVSSDLINAYYRRSTVETLGSQVLPPLSFTACRWPYPGSPAGALALYLPADTGLLPYDRGSACIPAVRGLSLTRTLPVISVRVACYEAAPFASCYGLRLWPAPLTGYDPNSLAGLLRTVSGQVRPVCYHTNPPSAYSSKRATDVSTSFQVDR